jgi:hypothetical protein
VSAMNQEMTDEDRALLAELVARYESSTIVRELKKLSRRAPGRPPDYQYNAAIIYGFVECWRKGMDKGTRGGIENACKKLEAILQKITPETRHQLSWQRLKGMYYEALKGRNGDPHIATLMDLSFRAAEEGSSFPILVHRMDDAGGLQGMILDTWAIKELFPRSGRSGFIGLKT